MRLREGEKEGEKKMNYLGSCRSKNKHGTSWKNESPLCVSISSTAKQGPK